MTVAGCVMSEDITQYVDQIDLSGALRLSSDRNGRKRTGEGRSLLLKHGS